MLWMYMRVMFGPVTHHENERLADLSFRERLVFAPLLLLIFWMGVMPQPFLDRMQPALDRTLILTRQRAEQSAMAAGLPAPQEKLYRVLPGAQAPETPAGSPTETAVVAK